MKLYYELLKKPIFTIENLSIYYKNIESARSAVKRLMADGMVMHIRRNMYTAISGETGKPVANRFQIACSINDNSFISHHSAMEYYGITDQVFYEVYVGSDIAFQSFEFDGYKYRFVKSNFPDGINDIEFSRGIRITDKERTLLDSIKSMDKIAGIEEVLSDIENIRTVNEEKLLEYLDLYHNQFLYQKTAYILMNQNDRFQLSDNFYQICKEKAGKSIRYLSSDYKNGTFDPIWNLVVPEIVFKFKNGGIVNADV